MKSTLKNFYHSDCDASDKKFHAKKRKDLAWLPKVALTAIVMFTVISLQAQSGGWDASSTNGTTGYDDHLNGVIQLLDVNASGCAGAAIHETSDTYDPTSGTVFNKCYEVFFGCPGDDEIGSDTKGDGMAFSFSKCAYNINNGACGGGLGYHGACATMITIEFDTWSSQGNAGFDNTYSGGTTGNNDEVAIHFGGLAFDANKITGANAGNLEDGLEHTVCISYDPATDILSVTIDGNNVLSYDLTGSPYDLPTYFGAGGLNQTWSSGKFGATNPSTVSNGADITDNVGGPLCPANIVITSPNSASVFGSCEGPLTITAASTPPAGNTVSSVEFFVDGTSVGTDNTEPYSTTWSSFAIGDHDITAVASYAPSGTTSTSAVTSISIGGGIELTSSAPVIDGTIDAIWGNYASTSLDNELPVPAATPVGSAADLSATYKVMRDATNLYIFVDVNDDDIQSNGGNNWDNDGLEIFINMGNDPVTTYGADDYQYAFVYNNATAIEYKHAPASLTGVTFAQGAKTGGYVMEISIPWSTLGGSPADGELIGFDVHVNEDDADGDSDRDAKIAWSDAIDAAFHNPSVFGTVQASACNPCPTGLLTGAATLCDASTTSPLSVSLTGAGPWSITYSIDGVTQPLVTGIAASPYVFQSGTGTHTYALVSVSNAVTSGCTGNATGTATITVNTPPVGHNGTFTAPATAILSVDNTGGTYQWYDAPVAGNLVFTGPVFTTPVLNDTAKYYVQEASGAPCRTEVIAIPLLEGVFFIPNLITPNNDGNNDAFVIGTLPSGSAVKVFNRWGDSVFQTNDYDNLWAGNNTSDGVYFYDIVLPDGKQFKGWLNIVR